jgi:hypothetical protein
MQCENMQYVMGLNENISPLAGNIRCLGEHFQATLHHQQKTPVRVRYEVGMATL